MSELDSLSSQTPFKNKETQEQKSKNGLRKSIERMLIIGGTVLLFSGFGNAISPSSNFDYSQANKIGADKRYNCEGGISLATGFLGFASLVLGAGYRNSRRQIEKYGFDY